MTEFAAVSDDIRLKRLKFRAWHRGMKEVDLILGPFADENAARLSEAELVDFELLLGVPDNDLYDWLSGRSAPPERFRTKLYDQIQDFIRRARGL
ncbi:MAG: succinate dehydrogenase assembly factor 2 [Alphaproteobacteria bacterium]|jgi:antitoxin CptB|nr:succinate dehydrogenase assembly factor 2 [Alphaproteobacteria bacterium]